MKNQKKRNLLFHALVPAVLAAFMIPTMAFAAEECRVSIPTVTVDVTGSGAPQDQTYEVVLEADPEWTATEAPMPEKTALVVVKGEEASFGEVVYQVPGDYKYLIRQKADASVQNIDYDSEGAYEVTVRITNDSNGGLASQVWAYREKDKDDVEAKVTDVRFTNQYTGGGDPGNNPGGNEPGGNDPGGNNPGGDNPGGDNPGGNPGGGGSSGGRPSGGSGSSGGSTGGGPGVEGDGLTQIVDETTPLGGLFPEGLSEMIPETIMDSIIPLAMLPQTGDTTSLGLWIMLLVLSSCGLGGLMVMRKRIA